MQTESAAKPETREEVLVKLLNSSRATLLSVVPLLYPTYAKTVLNTIDKIDVALHTPPKTSE